MRNILFNLLLMYCLGDCSLKFISKTPSAESLPLVPDRTIFIKTEEGTCMNLDLSPDGKTLVFDLLGNLFTLPVHGGRATQITEGLAWDRYALWSPDGKSIAYLSDGTGVENIWLMSTDGSGRRPITDEDRLSFISGFKWHSNGTSLLGNGKTFYLKGGEEALVTDLKGDSFYGLESSGIRYGSTVLSPNREWVAYVTLKIWTDKDDGDNELRIHNLLTGEDRCLICPVDQWRENWERFVFSHDSRSIWIGYGGKIHRIDILTGKDTVVPFTAKMKVAVAPFIYNTYSIPNDSLTVRYIKSADVSPDGKKLVFSALSKLYVMELPNGKPRPLIEQSIGQFSPKYSPDGNRIAYITNNQDGTGNLCMVSEDGKNPKKLTDEPGYYKNPEWSPDGKHLAVIKDLQGDPQFMRTYCKSTLLLISVDGGEQKKLLDNIPLIDKVSFTEDGQEITFTSKKKNTNIKEFKKLNITNGTITTIAKVDRFGEKFSLSPNGKYVVFCMENSIFLACISTKGNTIPLLLTKSTNTPILRLANFRRGHGPTWSRDSKNLTWLSTTDILTISLDSIYSARKKDKHGVGILKISEMPEAAIDTLGKIQLKVERSHGKGIFALKGAKIITMDKGNIIDSGTVLIKNDRILEVGPSERITIPRGTKVIELTGKTIIPGFIDMHAHNHPPKNLLVNDWWAFDENLNFGITTSRDPACSDSNFGYGELIESGVVKGPRLYGAVPIIGEKYKLRSLDDARVLARTYKALGAVFLKVHDNLSRRQRQYVAMAAREEGLNLTGHPDTGNYYGIYNLSILLDGFTGIEHVISHGKFYDDVQQLFRKVGIWQTPTLINSSGKFGEIQARYKSYLNYPPLKEKNVIPNKLGAEPNEEKFMDGKSRGMYYASNMAKLLKSGANITAGSHGDYPGIELHWELWLLKYGGLTPYEALCTATINAAKGLGVQNDLGSIKKGKIADLVILDKDPLSDIENTLTIFATIKNGVIFKSKSVRPIVSGM